MPPGQRPLSPHLQVYRWELSMAMSILHRATGVALSVGLLVLVWGLFTASSGPARFDALQSQVASPIGQVMLFGWTASLFYHLGNGIRHLFWDAGHGFELKTARLSGSAVLVFTVVATGLTWWIGKGGLT